MSEMAISQQSAAVQQSAPAVAGHVHGSRRLSRRM